jgi:hypothetical protein
MRYFSSGARRMGLGAGTRYGRRALHGCAFFRHSMTGRLRDARSRASVSLGWTPRHSPNIHSKKTPSTFPSSLSTYMAWMRF